MTLAHPAIVHDAVSGSPRQRLRIARTPSCAYAAHNRAVHMAYNLKEAARAIGKNRTTVYRAIKDGKVSGWRDQATQEWMVEPAELHRVYPPVDAPPRAQRVRAQVRTEARATERELQIRIDAQEKLIAAHEASIDDLRRRLDKAEDRMMQLLLAPPAQRDAPRERTADHIGPGGQSGPPGREAGAKRSRWQRFLAWRK